MENVAGSGANLDQMGDEDFDALFEEYLGKSDVKDGEIIEELFSR